MNLSFFVSPWFFVAGAACALGPVIIHLLNRRRYVTLPWAAMEFLREALRRNRRILELRDVALLILRTLAVLLVGAALARPLAARGVEGAWLLAFFAFLAAVAAGVVCIVVWSRPLGRWLALAAAGAFLAIAMSVSAFQLQSSAEHMAAAAEGAQPLHAVVLVDNSLSMGFQSLNGARLDGAKKRARQYLGKLPPGSRASIIPLCGSRRPLSVTPYPSLDDAAAALDSIEVADRSASIGQAVNTAQRACEAAPDLAKRIVLFTDQQESLWSGFTAAPQERGRGDFPVRDVAITQDRGPENLPDPGGPQFPQDVRMQVVDVSQGEAENTWVASLRVQDGLADVQTPATIIAEIRHHGQAPREVQVTLEADGAPVATRTITVEPGEGSREVAFQHTFNSAAPQPGRPALVAVRASLPPDRLPADDERHLVVPVVTALPVVFIDQYGSQLEDPVRNRYGETRRLRKLMAPGAGRDGEQQLIQVRHVTPEDVEQETLADARLVVVAGLADPGGLTPLLREYVEQGGQLLIAAGADFNPLVWRRDAWLDGEGILPAPLKPEPIGVLPDEAPERVRPFSIAYESVRNQWFFSLAGVPEEEMIELYAEPMFFKAVEVDVSEAAIADLRDEARRQWEQRLTPPTSGEPESTDAALAEEGPDWLLWSSVNPAEESAAPTADAEEREALAGRLAEKEAPTVLGRFDNGAPLLVERRIGRGRTMFVSTGLFSAWSTMHLTNAYLVYNRILRGMIEDTLPRRNFSTVERIAVPLPSAERDVAVLLSRPDEEAEEMLDVGFIGQERRGVTIENPLSRGMYQLVAISAETSAASPPEGPRWRMPLAVAGPAEESDLTPVPHSQLDRHRDAFEWVGPGEEISLAGVQLHGQNWWRWLILAALDMLRLEMAILATTGRSAPAETR
ncbi:MAG: BatA domain-containing protein [Planctomycetes bacterium]|nr:BatA domain-containing protein [Planctomycetota bacterium]